MLGKCFVAMNCEKSTNSLDHDMDSMNPIFKDTARIYKLLQRIECLWFLFWLAEVNPELESLFVTETPSLD